LHPDSTICRPATVAVEPANQLIRLTNRDAAVYICFSSSYSLSVTPPTYRYLYSVEYALDGPKNVKQLFSEGEMMAWGMDYAAQGDRLVIDRYWNARRVQRYVFECQNKCRLSSTCKIQRLPSDVPNVLSAAAPYLKTKNDRAQFVMGDNSRTAPLMDQLFLTAATGDPAAMSILHRLNEGMDAAASSMSATYIDYAEVLKKENCSWE
jgi:hypothetical protein